MKRILNFYCEKINLNNKGFSLLELLIVMVISIIAVGFVTVSLAVVNNADVGKAARTYGAALNTAKVQCMAKGSEAGKMTVTMTDGSLYYQIGDQMPERICTSRITVSGKNSQGNSIAIADGYSGTISFNSAGMVYNNSTDTLTSIVFEYGNRKVETVLYPETGKYTTNLL